jgi:midasin (ATPase involved in ribosome maturation)
MQLNADGGEWKGGGGSAIFRYIAVGCSGSRSCLRPDLTHTHNHILCSLQGGPVLVEGPPGSGKSAAIWDLAHRTGNATGVIELHLDDSIDSKSLLGTYVCTDVPGEFTWSPGPLTQAVVHGRSVI